MQKRRTDLTGMRFGRLKVLSFDHFKYKKKPNGYEYKVKVWLCECDCGTQKLVEHSSLTSGNTQSCGCYMKEHQHEFIKQYTKPLNHPRSHRLHEIWIGMKERCNNPRNQSYKHYGGRGIKVCEEWNDIHGGYDNFFKWAMSNGYADDLSIDRINVDGDYEPNNCRWSTRRTQSLNKRDTLYLTHNGIRKPLLEWAEEYNIPYERLKFRIQRGWNVDKALTYPPMKEYQTEPQYYTFHGETRTMKEWSMITGIKQTTLLTRINNYGWSIEKTLTTPVNARKRHKERK